MMAKEAGKAVPGDCGGDGESLVNLGMLAEKRRGAFLLL